MSPSSAQTVAGYIKTFPKPTQVILTKIRQLIREAAPKAVESISYQMPAYKMNSKPLVYFGAWKEHIGFYATPSGNTAFKKELAPYKAAKGSVRFSLDEPMPYGLIKKMIEFRVKEIARETKLNTKKSA